MGLSSFHPATRKWFLDSFGKATPVQDGAWKPILEKKHTLIAAPTGSGKTLAGFMAVIDSLVHKSLAGALEDKTYVVYISPLKALSNDIEKNLRAPLLGVQEELENCGHLSTTIRASVRTGDTPQSERAAMIKKPPHILVTTPESLFLLITSVRGREMLSNVEHLIVDEIHAIVEDKRGSHMSLTIERLDELVGGRLHRIGISATQKPIEETAKFLVGTHNFNSDGSANCAIIDTGHQRELTLHLEIPDSPLTAVMANEVWEEIYDKIEKLIHEHQTTLIFVNTRRLSERLAHDLRKRLGEDAVTAHHGSLSKDQRFDAENRLKTGQLKALVATASLELGIDIGYIDLVVQISSPRKISAFLQRVGRAGHQVGGLPKGVIFPLTRDDLVECTAMLDAVRRRELDILIIPEEPVDILCQQIIAAAACEELDEDEFFDLVKQSYPYQNLSRHHYDQTLEMMTTGFTNRRGYKRAYIHRDAINKKIRARKGARLAVLTSGGSIPDMFDFDVILEPTGIKVGTINEDFAIESMPGDIFQLGSSSWQILKVEDGKVRVSDASGMPPSLPFWLGEAPGRSNELSFAVSRLRQELNDLFDRAMGVAVGPKGNLEPNIPNTEREVDYEQIKLLALDWLINAVGISEAAAEQLVGYMLTAKLALGEIPTQDTLMLERFFDEAGDMHLVVHSPYGSDINTAWGLALRKRFCRGFNFELQAAATEDAIILSLSQTHSFALEDIYKYLKSKTVRNITTQAMLDNPIFGIRWRWNATRAMAVLRNRAGKKVPAPLQRMEAEDMIALSFPDQIACLENIQGDREVPDHPLVRQTIHDCLTEAMDIDGLEAILIRMESGDMRLLTADLREPSPLAQEIINAKPYAFLDEAGLEERRTRAIKSRRWLDPSEAKELGKLNPEAIRLVKQEAWPRVADVDELHDALVLLGYLTEDEGVLGHDQEDWQSYFSELVSAGRATTMTVAPDVNLWVAAERLPELMQVFPDATCAQKLQLPDFLWEKQWDASSALVELMRGRMESLGPVLTPEIAEPLGIDVFKVDAAMLSLESQGFIFRGKFTGRTDDSSEWCERRLLQRIHKYTLDKLRKEIEPIHPADFMRYLFRWQHVITDDAQPQGTEALQNTLFQLEAFEAPAASWETEILPARLQKYDPMWLDVLSLSGRIIWGRLRSFKSAGQRKSSPIKTTPVALVQRMNYDLWKTFSDEQEPMEFGTNTSLVLEFLRTNKASFFDEVVAETRLLNTQVEDALDELAASGLITSDSFTGLRALLTPANNRPKENRRRSNGRKAIYGMEHAGRWNLLEHKPIDLKADIQNEHIEKIARILLSRYGVVFRKMIDRESFVPKWRDLVRVYRRMEARGEIRGGYFVTNVYGEQFALPEAVSQMRKLRKEPKTGQEIVLSAVDPLNLTGIITPGRRIHTTTGNRILYRDGVPVAVKEGDDIHYLEDTSDENKWKYQKSIVRRRDPASLRAYLGK